LSEYGAGKLSKVTMGSHAIVACWRWSVIGINVEWYDIRGLGRGQGSILC